VNKESISKVPLNSEWKSFEVSGHNFARWKMQPVTWFGIRLALPIPQPLNLVTVVK